MTKPYSVLVVEDRPDSLDILRIILEKSGFVVDTARTGGEALSRIDERCQRGGCYDLVSLDIDLPDVRGTILALYIRARFPTLPFIFLSAYGSLPAFVDAAKSLNAPMLTKPVEPEVFVKLVTDTIETNPHRLPPQGERREPERSNESGFKRRATDAPMRQDLPEVMREAVEAVAAQRKAASDT